MDNSDFDILLKLLKEDPEAPENGWQLTTKDKGEMLIESYKKKTKEFSADINLIQGYMAGIDIPLAFEDLKNPNSDVFSGGMMDKIEWVDESQNIFRMLINIPLFTQREFVVQM